VVAPGPCYRRWIYSVPWAGLTGTIAGWVFRIAALFRSQTSLFWLLSYSVFYGIARLVLSDIQAGRGFCVE
jgi:hypothetical protein